MVIEKRKRGRPSSGIVKPDYVPTGGKKGRPKKENKIEHTSYMDLTEEQKRMRLAELFLSMQTTVPSDKQKKQYLKLVTEMPTEKYSGKGWDIYRYLLKKAMT